MTAILSLTTTVLYYSLSFMLSEKKDHPGDQPQAVGALASSCCNLQLQLRNDASHRENASVVVISEKAHKTDRKIETSLPIRQAQVQRLLQRVKHADTLAMQIYCSVSESAETASDTNSSRLSIRRETEGLENTSGSSAVRQRGLIKSSYDKEE